MAIRCVLQAGHEEPQDPDHVGQDGADGEVEFTTALRDRLAAALGADDRFTALSMPGLIPAGTTADAALFLHADGVASSTPRGLHFGYPPTHDPSVKLAARLRAAMNSLDGAPPARPDNSTEGLRSYYGFGKITSDCPKVVVENGFMTNPFDRHWLLCHTRDLALAQYRALCEYFELSPKQIDLPDRTLRLTQPFMKGFDIKIIQVLLNDLGHGPLPTDGAFGLGTEAAVKAFQRAKQLEPLDGVIGPATRAALAAAGPAAGRRTLRLASPTMKGDDVKALQQRLNELGFGPLDADGDFGLATDLAVRRFQEAHRLGVDGVVGSATWDALDRATKPQPADPPQAAAPIIRLGDPSQAPLLSYNVPDETTYHGRNFIDLAIASEWFKANHLPSPVGEALATRQARDEYDEDGTTSEPIDAVVLSIRVATPSVGSTVTGTPAKGAPLKITGSASLDWGEGNIASVAVKVGDGDFTDVEQVSGNWATWSTNRTVKTAGRVAIVARATHSDGKTSATDERTVTIELNESSSDDHIPPALMIAYPPPNHVEVAAEGKAIEIEGTASDAESGVALVAVSADGVPLQVQNPKGDWSEWRAAAHLGPGEHQIAVRAADKNGNVASESSAVKFVSPSQLRPTITRLLLIESYQLSTFLGSYGAGKTLKTFSMFPGEETKLFVKTYTRSSDEAKSASSILDSFTETSAKEFETATAREQSYKENFDESFKYSVRGEAAASWGWGSARATGEMSGGTNAAREEFAKNTVNALQKHSAQASAKRDITLTAEHDVKRESGEEETTERVIKNINVSRTLNIVVRQMLQEFISILHLVDVRIGYVEVSRVVGEDPDQPPSSTGSNEVQALNFHGSVTGGTFTLTFQGETTRELPFNASDDAVRAALEALPSVGVGNVAVAGGAGPTPYTITFEGRLGQRDVPALVVAARLEGSAAAMSVTETVRGAPSNIVVQYREATLPQLRSLLAEKFIERDSDGRDVRAELEKAILHQLTNIWDWEDNHHAIAEVAVRKGPIASPNAAYLRVKKNKTSTWVDAVPPHTSRTVPGIIISVAKNTMRTDAMVIDALLGGGVALDPYSSALQETAVAARKIANTLAETEAERNRLAQALVATKDAEGAKIFEQVFGVLRRPAADDAEDAGSSSNGAVDRSTDAVGYQP